GDENGPAERAAKLVEAERGTPDTAAVGEEVIGVQFVVAEEFISGEMKIVGSALRDHVEDSPGSAAIFSGKAVGLHLEFLHHVRIGIHHRLILAGGGIGSAIQ